ncbi:hypothetical protein AWP81_03045 [Escherichia coli]|nr:hypothetical protein ACN58_20620 [Escherichia coli]OKS96959.1 hypothetical protein ACN54_21095 [Escherichia coli]OKT24318.1 hypothetical protein ACN57_11050 [Escherichia coli]OKT31359.1 hypothetical protein ACN62_14625 [Escherichia coli]OKT96523.1 hypothetical protein ACN70_00410 [Escherichia coli]
MVNYRLISLALTMIVKLNDWPSNRVHELLPWNCSTVK